MLNTTRNVRRIHVAPGATLLIIVLALWTASALAQGEPCSQCGPGPHFIDFCGPFPPVGTDLVANNGAVVGIDLDLDCVQDVSAVLRPCPEPNQLLHVDKTLGPIDDSLNFPGTSPVDGHPTGPGLDVIDTEVVSMCLTNGAVTMAAGVGGPSAFPLQSSLGTVAEDLTTPDPSWASSIFDMFFEVSGLPGGPLYNQSALQVESRIDCLPPAANYLHPVGICVPLTTSGICQGGVNAGAPCIYDVNCSPGGSCAGTTLVANLVSANHSVNRNVCQDSPLPECNGDCPNGEICLPTGNACECVPDVVPCELSDSQTCDGPCPNAGEVCTVDPTGGPCFCEPPPVLCEETFPTCDGPCPIDTHCELGTSGTVVLPDPGLPPESDPPDCDQILSQYEGQDVHALFPGGVDLSNPIHKCFQNVVRTDDGSGNEIETFDSTLEGQVDLGVGPVPVTLSGPVEVVTFGKTGNTTGTFPTEIVSMSLTGDVGGIPIEIRESPSLPSTGQTSITDLGGGLWQIDSFFDVFTELSVDGGPFQPQTNGPGRMVLVPTDPDLCECVPDVLPCELSDPATCDGPCPNAGEVCTVDPTGGPCFCEPPPVLCEDTVAPVCGGSCPPDERCAALDTTCECVPCAGIVPGPIRDVGWSDPGRMTWVDEPCSVAYNTYRLTATSLVDADADGLADDYGTCFQPGLTATVMFDSSPVPSGFANFYLVTGVDSAGEGSMGFNSNLVTRPNRTPCP